MFDSISSAWARYRMRYPVYVFHHIPKCGGTSVRQILDDWFHVYNDYYDEDTTEPVPPVDLKYLNSDKCLCGHFGHHGYMIDQRYPQIFGSFSAAKRYRVFSFLRDPLEMRCSLFRHQVGVGAADRVPENLLESIKQTSNYYSRVMGLDDRNYKHKLDQYFFIGMQDNLQLSFDVLASIIQKPRMKLPVKNKSLKTSGYLSDALSAQEIAEFKQENQLDYKIYDYARSRFEAKESEYMS